MSKRFRYWFRCTTVATLTAVITFNPAWAGLGMRGLLKRHARSQPAVCCVPVSSSDSICCEQSALPTCCEMLPPACPPHENYTQPQSDSCCIGAVGIPNLYSEQAPPVVAAPSEQCQPTQSAPPQPPAIVPAGPADAPQDSPEDASPVEQPSPSDSVEPALIPDEPALIPDEPALIPDEPASPPESASPSDDPFGAPPADPAPTADDLFGTPPADPAPTADDLFGTPPADPAPAADDLFGTPPADPAPAADDLFGTPPADPAPAVDDLFGTPPADPAPTADDLFGAPPADDLFGDPPAPAERSLFDMPTEPAPTEPAPGDLGDDIFGAPTDQTNSLFNEPEPMIPALPVDDLFGPPADSSGDVFNPGESDAGDLFRDPDVSNADDFFGQPTSIDKPSAAHDLDDLFGTPISEIEPVVEPTAPVQSNPIEDIFKATQLRTWHDNTGLFQVDAKLIAIHQDRVRLLKDSGKFCTLPTRRLSTADRQYVERIAVQLPANSVKYVSVEN